MKWLVCLFFKISFFFIKNAIIEVLVLCWNITECNNHYVPSSQFATVFITLIQRSFKAFCQRRRMMRVGSTLELELKFVSLLCIALLNVIYEIPSLPLGAFYHQVFRIHTAQGKLQWGREGGRERERERERKSRTSCTDVIVPLMFVKAPFLCGTRRAIVRWLVR